MAYVEVDVELDVFDTWELLRELKFRFKRAGKKGLTEQDKKDLISEMREANKELGITETIGIDIKTLEDKMKLEHLSKVWNKYSCGEIEERLPEFQYSLQR
jgi:hypothetical protein